LEHPCHYTTVPGSGLHGRQEIAPRECLVARAKGRCTDHYRRSTFLATPLSAFPGLNKANKRFRKWLAENPCVYSHRPDFVHAWDCFLEGSGTILDSGV